MTATNMDLREVLEKTADTDFLREMIGFTAQRLMELEVETLTRYPVGTVACVRDPEMKQAWCLAASSTEATAKDLTGYYGSRELSLGYAIPRISVSVWATLAKVPHRRKPVEARGGMGTVHVSTPERRDRLWLINGLAVVLLTLLGAASEAVGYDRMLKTNTSKRREHSLFSTGLHGLRPDPHDARALVTPADAGVYSTARTAAAVLSDSRAGVVALCIYEGSHKDGSGTSNVTK